MKTQLPLIFVTILLLAACSPKAGPTPAGTLPPIITETPPTITSQVPNFTPITAPTSFLQVLSSEVEINIEDLSVNPGSVTISAGTTVKWGNKDYASHTVTGDDGSWGSNSLAKGDTFFFTFSKAGTFSYHCGVHPSMKATITVVAQ